MDRQAEGEEEFRGECHECLVLQSQGAEMEKTTALTVRSHYDIKSQISSGECQLRQGIAGIQLSKSER